MRGDQGEAPATVRRAKRDLLSDHASHRNADDVGPIPPKVVHDPNRIIRHRGNGSKKRPTIALTDAQVIVMAAAMIRSELVHLRPPNRAPHAKPHDEEDRRPLLPKGPVSQPGPGLRKR